MYRYSCEYMDLLGFRGSRPAPLWADVLPRSGSTRASSSPGLGRTCRCRAGRVWGRMPDSKAVSSIAYFTGWSRVDARWAEGSRVDIRLV